MIMLIIGLYTLMVMFGMIMGIYNAFFKPHREKEIDRHLDEIKHGFFG